MKNDFKGWALGPGSNVLDQADFEALGALIVGFAKGRLPSDQVNKVLRQGTFVAAAVAQMISDTLSEDVLDDGDVAGFAAKLEQAITQIADTQNFVDTSEAEVLLATLTASGGINMDYPLTSAYRAFRFRLVNVLPGSAGQSLLMRTSTDNGATFDATGYKNAAQGINSAGGSESAFASTSEVVLAGTVKTISSTAADGGVSGDVVLYNARSSTQSKTVRGKTGYINADGNLVALDLSGQRQTAAPITNIRFTLGGAPIASGAVEIWGAP